MNSRFFLILCLVWVPLLICHAGDSQTGLPPVHLQQMDSDYDVDQLKGPGVVIHHKATAEGQDEKLPSTAVRDKAFKNADLYDAVQGWDQLDRDMLYIRATTYTLNELIEKYPNLPRHKLAILQRFASKKH